MTDAPKTLELNKANLLVLATDGFLEWTNADGEQFGLKRLEAAIRESKEESRSELISAIYRAVVLFSEGTKQQDDLRAVVIKRK